MIEEGVFYNCPCTRSCGFKFVDGAVGSGIPENIKIAKDENGLIYCGLTFEENEISNQNYDCAFLELLNNQEKQTKLLEKIAGGKQ